MWRVLNFIPKGLNPEHKHRHTGTVHLITEAAIKYPAGRISGQRSDSCHRRDSRTGRFHHTVQNSVQFKTCELFISEIFHLVLLGCSCPQVTEATNKSGRTCCIPGYLMILPKGQIGFLFLNLKFCCFTMLF